MNIIKFAAKVFAAPAVLILTLLQWVSLFFVSSTAVIFNLLAGLCFFLSVACYLTKTASGAECFRMLIMSFVIYILPHIAEWLIVRVITLKLLLLDFIRS